MVLGVISILGSATWFVRLFLRLERLDAGEVVPMVVGGIAGGLAAWSFVPWLLRREAMKKRTGG